MKLILNLFLFTLLADSGIANPNQSIGPFEIFEVTGTKGSVPCPRSYPNPNCDESIGRSYTQHSDARMKAQNMCRAINNTSIRVSEWVVINADSVKANFICKPLKSSGDTITGSSSGGSYTKSRCDGSQSVNDAKIDATLQATRECGYPEKLNRIKQVSEWEVRIDEPRYDSTAGWFCYSYVKAKFQCL